ncbi:hypothetical protein L873DRAFT_1781473 [Choiromyces venosus 120613-1]|uniref:Secreted protein n=1 Tax=Choiromyces venosus 120613-1 TaxID=1336337 RepID=A0A3N4J2C1_9PEZI|nr:hypothetical protein L873DRAFT_1781473 [Choiromyces venosus 120613-1]
MFFIFIFLYLISYSSCIPLIFFSSCPSSVLFPFFPSSAAIPGMRSPGPTGRTEGSYTLVTVCCRRSTFGQKRTRGARKGGGVNVSSGVSTSFFFRVLLGILVCV